MDADNNEVENDSGVVNSIRLKYKGGRRVKIINKEVTKPTKKEIISQLEEKQTIPKEKIIIKEESNTKEIIVPNKVLSKITTTKEVFPDNDIGKSRQEITTTKKEIKESNDAGNISKKLSSLNEDKEPSYSQKTFEIANKGNMNINNTDFKRTGTQGREIKEESSLRRKIITTMTNQGSRTQSEGKKEDEIKIRDKGYGRRSRGGKGERIKKIIQKTLYNTEGSESQGRSTQKEKIISLKNVITNFPSTNGRQSYTGKSQNKSQISEKIDLTEGLSNKDIKYIRKEMINSFIAYPGHTIIKETQIERRTESNLIQGQNNNKDTKDSRKEIKEKINSSSGKKMVKKSQKQGNEVINLTEGLNSKDVKDLRNEKMDQFFSYPDQNGRKKIKSKEKPEINIIGSQNNKEVKNSRKETNEKLKSNPPKNSIKQGQKRVSEEIDLTEGLSKKDIKDIRKEMINSFIAFPGHNIYKETQIERRSESNLIQRQNNNKNEIKGSTKEKVEKTNSRTGQNSVNQIKSKEKKEINLVEGKSKNDIKGLRMNMVDQFFSYPGQHSRNSSQGRGQNQRINIKNEINNIPKTNVRGNSEDDKLKAKKEVYTSQRLNSRRESQNSKSQAITTNSNNRRSERNSSNITSNNIVTKVKQNYPSKQEPKTKIIAQTGLNKSNKNQINVKEIDHNKRLNAGRNSSPNKRPYEKPVITKKTDKNPPQVQKNPIQVQKVLVTDTVNFQKKANNQKPIQIYKSNNNYNTNTYIHKNPNTNIATKLAINDLKSKEHKGHSSTMTNFYQNRDNISTITIDETGKIPKKPYVLHVRQLERIRSKSRMRIVYTNNMEETDPIKIDFNHKMIEVKDITRDFQTISQLNSGEKMSHRYSSSNLTSISNIGRREINESGKIPKKQVVVSMRKNEIIKSAKKPFKLNYKNFLKSSTSSPDKNEVISKKAEIKSNFKNKMNNVVENEKIGEKRNVYNSRRNSRESRNGSQGASQKVLNKNINNNKTIINETKIKSRRKNYDLDKEEIEGRDANSSLPITKSEIIIGKNREGYNNLKMGNNVRNIVGNSGVNNKINISQVINSSAKNKEIKTETKSHQVITADMRNKRNRVDGKEGSGSKIITVKKVLITKTESKNNTRGNSIERKENAVTINKIIRKTNQKMN